MYFVRLWGHKLENNVVQGSAAGAQIVARLGSQGCWRLSDQNLLAELSMGYIFALKDKIE